MSTAHAQLLPFDQPVRRQGPQLEALPSRRRKPRLTYALVAIAGAVLIALAQLGMTILTAQSSYDLAAVEQQQRQLTLDQQELTEDLAGLSSPQYLAANASALGMVIDSTPSYLRLSDSAILGSGAPAGDTSTVNVQNGNAAANALIAQTPLVTDEDMTIADVTPQQDVPETVTEAPVLEGGLPAPNTH
ncbi:hypothetical protein GCM10010922_06300 [Microbacterium sorbitolivorans]|uniref:Cell division protein FtsL n=1 Tax=Microbacterium sorbitolivorans TaxID=1867410 RepID=A0A367Y5W7_9MICO|nr:hypothetical protein [Microbacterium sorbitolivorans]RCK61237.1 hypothetical protein DTO57_00865 [Microbacterium sorbitolivorans]GGF33837.1 hypothetical protein GCM10010922_06300 [Microbacterium sorbitolivorans]